MNSYTFDASAQTITLDAIYELEQLLIITNVTDNIIIYNFADPLCGGTLVGNTLTLDYNTSTMSDTDALQIYVDVPNTAMLSVVQDGLVEIVRQLQSLRNDGGMADGAGRVRVNLDSTSATFTIPTVAVVANFQSYNTNTIPMNQMNMAPRLNRSLIVIT